MYVSIFGCMQVFMYVCLYVRVCYVHVLVGEVMDKRFLLEGRNHAGY